MNKNKITITNISEEVLKKKGFDNSGCYGCACNDSCCRYGCDVDKESYDLIFQNREIIEKRIGIKLENCFEKEWSCDREYLGNNSIDTKTIGSHCVFKLKDKRGCILFHLAFDNNISKRIIPSICRLYPLTWGGGELMITDDYEKDCSCLREDNKTSKTILETQMEQIKDIFRIEGKAKEIIFS